MIKTNEDKLVKMSVIGEVFSPQISNPYRVSQKGELKVFPGTGGITYNVKIGDKVCGLQADHVEPGVTIKNSNELANGALNTLSCAGNIATVVSGDAKGKTGFVTGKHGGCEHVLIYFDKKTLDKLVIGDKIQIKSIGAGLELTDFPNIKMFNLDPSLFKKLNIKKDKKGKLQVGVTHFIPAKIMGSGLGKDNVNRGDYDIQLFDENTVKEYDLSSLKFGDVVAVLDADNSYGRIYKEGAISIGIIVHSNCIISGHGPGFMTIMTSSTGEISPIIDKNANLTNYLLNKKD